MAKNLNSKCKQCRRAGEKLFLKADRCNTPKCAMIRKNYPPGQQGATGKKGKQSAYGLQLQEKQKAKKQYNLLERQFKLTFEDARKTEGDTGENLLRLLEMRLDNVAHKAGFANSKSQSRQFVNHGHFTINGKKNNIPSTRLKQGDIIEVKARSKKSKIFSQLPQKLSKHVAPGWLNLEPAKLSVKVLHEIKEEDIKNIPINAQIIVEYYSR